MITRKHFEQIAEIIRSDKGFYSDGENMRCLIARELAAMCKQDNPNFDHERFLRACDAEN